MTTSGVIVIMPNPPPDEPIKPKPERRGSSDTCASSTQSLNIVIDKAEFFKFAPYRLMKPNNSMSTLVDDVEQLGQPRAGPPSQSNSWTPLQTWDHGTSNWSARSTYSPRKPKWFRDLKCIKIMVLVIFICMIITVGLVIGLSSGKYNSSQGPRGQIPFGSNARPPVKVLKGTNETFFGVSIDWTMDDPYHFNEDLGRSAAIQDSNFYLGEKLTLSGRVNSSGFLHDVPDLFLWTSALIQGTGSIMGMTIIPTVPLEKVNLKQAIPLIVEKCKAINNQGLAVMLRFAPEMNGNWYPYGQNPESFVIAFRNLSAAIHVETNNTAMVWSPASGLGYPFIGGKFFPAASNPLLDTNRNGYLDTSDDPYAPYYPGDLYVDWIGFSCFYSADPGNGVIFPIQKGFYQDSINDPQKKPYVSRSFNNALPPPSTEFYERLAIENQLKIGNFYYLYSSNRDKPLAIYSTGAAVFRGPSVKEYSSESMIKIGWLQQMYNANFLQQFPTVKALVLQNGADLYPSMFDDSKTVMDCSVTRNPSVLSAFQSLIATLPITFYSSNRTDILAQ